MPSYHTTTVPIALLLWCWFCFVTNCSIACAYYSLRCFCSQKPLSLPTFLKHAGKRLVMMSSLIPSHPKEKGVIFIEFMLGAIIVHIFHLTGPLNDQARQYSHPTFINQKLRLKKIALLDEVCIARNL